MVTYGVAGPRPPPQVVVECSSTAERKIIIKVTAFVSMYVRCVLELRYDRDHSFLHRDRPLSTSAA